MVKWKFTIKRGVFLSKYDKQFGNPKAIDTWQWVNPARHCLSNYMEQY